MAPGVRTSLEVENAFRQYDLTIDIIKFYTEIDRPFSLRLPIILDLQRAAVQGIEATAGQIRTSEVGIHGSNHAPPPPHLVNAYLVEFCDFVNANWHERTAFFLSAYAMWRLNWIHPFTDGNGRTSRALSYALLCIKLGYVLPGSPRFPSKSNRITPITSPRLNWPTRPRGLATRALAKWNE